MADERELIRARVSLVELVGDEVRLQKRGKNWTGLCPFHDDKNPSFTVNDQTGSYRCWSCGAKGDMFTWVMETQRVTFREALEFLAKRAGIELTARPAQDSNKRGTYEGAMNAAQEFFASQLFKTSAAAAYCFGRGLTEEVLKQWEIGFAPDVEEGLPTHLKKSGFSLADCKELFLVDGDQDRGYASKFRARLMFPIRDERGALVAFGGRLLSSGIPKYINSSDTPIYSKRRVLYGMHRAKDTISKKNRAVLVEGYLDVIACHAAGVTEAVASLGTSLSEDHAKMLARWCKQVTILYDNDAAGQKAAERASAMLEEAGLVVTVALMPPGEDPDTLLRTSGAGAVARAAEGGLTPVDFRILRLQGIYQPTQPEYWQEVVAVLATASALDLERLVQELAPTYPGLRDPIAARQALKNQIRDYGRHSAQARQGGATGPRRRERFGRSEMTGPERALLLALGDPELRAPAWAAVRQPELFGTTLAYDIATMLRDRFEDDPPAGAFALWGHDLTPEALRFTYAEMLAGHAERLDAEVVRDSLERLRQKLSQNLLRASWQQSTPDDTALSQINEKLRELKGSG